MTLHVREKMGWRLARQLPVAGADSHPKSRQNQRFMVLGRLANRKQVTRSLVVEW